MLRSSQWVKKLRDVGNKDAAEDDRGYEFVSSTQRLHRRRFGITSLVDETPYRKGDTVQVKLARAQSVHASGK